MAITFDVNVTGMPTQAKISDDGLYLMVSHYYSPFVTFYKRSGEDFTKLADPATLPPAGTNGKSYDCAIDEDAIYLVVGHTGTPFVTIYKRTGDTFAKLADPTGGLPSGVVAGVALSRDGVYLALRHFNSPYLSVYKRTGDAFARLANPTPAIGDMGEGSSGVCFSSDALYLVVGRSTAPFLRIYKRSGDTFTGLPNLAVQPHSMVYRCLFSPDDLHLVVTTYSATLPYFIVYKRVDDTFTKLPDPIQPDFSEPTPSPHIRGIAFSGSGVYFGIAFLSVPNAFIYIRSGDNFIKQAVPAGLPSLPNRGMTISFFDDQRHAVLGTSTSVPPNVVDPNFTGIMTGFSFDDALPLVAIPIAPINNYLSISSDIVFSWQHNIDSGTPQSKADLQYRLTGGDWLTLATIIGPALSATIPANTLITGQIQWRVRTYNQDDIAGDWSAPVSFMGVGAPPTPSILTVTSHARPTISWSSIDQSGYQLQILSGTTLIWDSDATAGIVKSRRIPIFLSTGSYTARLRVINPSQFWSAWTAAAFTVDFVEPAVPTITAVAITDGALITITPYAEGIVRAYLLRDGIAIADITGVNSYTDYSPLSGVVYVVRVVDEEDNFADSNEASVLVVVNCAILAPIDDLSDIIRMNKKALGQPGLTRQRNILSVSRHYAGRKYPIHSISEFEDEGYSIAYYYTSVAEFARLDALIDRRQTLLYRDMLGNRMYGTITSITHTQEQNMIIFTFMFNRADFVEAIEYAAPWIPPEEEEEPLSIERKSMMLEGKQASSTSVLGWDE